MFNEKGNACDTCCFSSLLNNVEIRSQVLQQLVFSDLLMKLMQVGINLLQGGMSKIQTSLCTIQSLS